MGAENASNESQKKDPAVERAEREMKKIEDVEKDSTTELAAKKELVTKKIEEKKKEQAGLLGSGKSSDTAKYRRLEAELHRLDAALIRINQNMEAVKDKSAEKKDNVADRLEAKASDMKADAAVIEGRDDKADKRQVELAELKQEEARQKAIVGNPPSPEAKAAALEALEKTQKKIERLEKQPDRAQEKSERAARLLAEGSEIRADLAKAESAIASLDEDEDAKKDVKTSADGEKQKKGPSLSERMSSSSENLALQVADNPPKKGDFMATTGFQFRLIWLNFSMAMSAKPLSWDPKKFDAGRREILAKVAGMKLTDTEDGKIMVESVPRDKDYQAPLGGTQRVFREYFGEGWWKTLEGIKAPVGKTPGTKLSEFKAGIPNPVITEADKAKQRFVEDIVKAGMKEEDQILPWLEKNSVRVKKAMTETPAAPAQAPASAPAQAPAQAPVQAPVQEVPAPAQGPTQTPETASPSNPLPEAPAPEASPAAPEAPAPEAPAPEAPAPAAPGTETAPKAPETPAPETTAAPDLVADVQNKGLSGPELKVLTDAVPNSKVFINGTTSEGKTLVVLEKSDGNPENYASNFKVYYGVPEKMEEQTVATATRMRDGGTTTISFDGHTVYYPSPIAGGGPTTFDDKALT